MDGRSLPLVDECSLDTDALRGRVAEWRRLAARARAVGIVPTGVRIDLDPRDAGAARRLIALEMRCCPFFVFEIDDHGFTVGGSAAAVERAKRLLLAD